MYTTVGAEHTDLKDTADWEGHTRGRCYPAPLQGSQSAHQAHSPMWNLEALPHSGLGVCTFPAASLLWALWLLCGELPQEPMGGGGQRVLPSHWEKGCKPRGQRPFENLLKAGNALPKMPREPFFTGVRRLSDLHHPSLKVRSRTSVNPEGK